MEIFEMVKYIVLKIRNIGNGSSVSGMYDSDIYLIDVLKSK